ncbi:hypothetical protein Bca52824_035055 [Brassica carinata]|uniref:CR-type domain-containing protein n=1 Tax=Brassica carinata TaxID=52824 RepID=A0A8X7RZX1_BRACI|nr:hypothetical protein Bca52824_035055 [Brassica carinata]
MEKEIEISKLESCGTCEGSGAKPGTKPTKCTTCGGQGQVVLSARTPLGVFQQVMTCSSCNSTGEISTPCGTCSGDDALGRLIFWFNVVKGKWKNCFGVLFLSSKHTNNVS